MEVGRQNLVEQLIAAAVTSGAHRAQARRTPEAKGGLLRVAEKASQRVQALAEEIIATARLDGAAAATLPVTAR